MDLTFTPEETELQGRVRQYVQQVLMPLEKEYVQHDLLTEELGDQLEEEARKRGLWALETPREIGGQGYGSLAMCLTNEENARALLNIMQPLGYGGNPSMVYWNAATPEQREKYFA